MHISPMISSLSRGETSLLQRGRRFPWTKIGCTNQANFTTTKRTNLGTLTQPQRPQIKNIFPTQAIPASARFFAAMLSPADREKAVSKLQSWQDVSDRNAISKRFEFKNFQQAWSFMSDVAKVAEEMGHHPEWSNTYNTVAVTLTTHDCNGVSQKDITLAETMDSLASKILGLVEDNGPSLAFQPTCDLYDEYLDAARVPYASFLNLGGRKQFAGRAVTVKCFEDNSKIKDLVENKSGRGKVLVVDGGASMRCALLGDMVAKKAVDNGWEGLIIFANVRDVEELRKLDIGVLALGSTPRKSTRRGEGQVDIPVLIGDVWCRPGDRVYADENGIIILD